MPHLWHSYFLLSNQTEILPHLYKFNSTVRVFSERFNLSGKAKRAHLFPYF